MTLSNHPLALPRSAASVIAVRDAPFPGLETRERLVHLRPVVHNERAFNKHWLADIRAGEDQKVRRARGRERNTPVAGESQGVAAPDRTLPFLKNNADRSLQDIHKRVPSSRKIKDNLALQLNIQQIEWLYWGEWRRHRAERSDNDANGVAVWVLPDWNALCRWVQDARGDALALWLRFTKT